MQRDDVRSVDAGQIPRESVGEDLDACMSGEKDVRAARESRAAAAAEGQRLRAVAREVAIGQERRRVGRCESPRRPHRRYAEAYP